MLLNRQIELIAGLVEGTLEDESEARALLDRSEEARAEYEAQRTAFQALHTAAPAAMTEQERASLRREVWTELRREPSQTVGSTPWYYRFAPVAAALVLVVGVLAVLDRGFQGADESADTSSGVAGQLSADTTEAAGLSALESARDDAAEPAAEGDGGADLAGEEGAPPAPASDEFFSTIAELVRSGGLTTSSQLLRDFDGEAELQDVTACVESAGLTGYEIVGEASSTDHVGGGTEPSSYIVLVPENVEIGPDTEITFVSVTECEVVHIEG